MFEMLAFLTYAVIGFGVVNDVVVPTAAYTNDTYVQPAVGYTKELVTEGVDYVKEKIN